MRILHVISGDLWAGAESQALALLSDLASAEHMQIVAALMNEGELASRLRQSGIQVVVIPETSYGPLRITFSLACLMRTIRPDVVHTHRAKENILASVANAVTGRARCLRTMHGGNEHTGSRWRSWLLKLDTWCGRNLQDAIIAVSGELGTALEEAFEPRAIVVIENGIDVDLIRKQVALDRSFKLPSQMIHIGFAGRLVPVKRVDVFLEIALLLTQRREMPHYQFHVFGDGPLKETMSARAIALGISESVVFHGFCRNAVARIAAMDAMIICSDHEGLPMTLLESLAVGTPVVGHSVGAIPEVLSTCEGGITVSDQQPASYVAAILDVVRNESTAASQRRAELVATYYSSRRTSARVAALYRRLTAGSTD